MIAAILRWLSQRKHRIGETRVVDVTPMDISMGTPGVATACAITMAARRIFPDADRIVTSRIMILVEKDGIIEEWRDTTGRMPLFTHMFDYHKPVKPDRFTVARVSRKEDPSRVRTSQASAS